MEQVMGIEPALSAWEVCGAVALLPADSVSCGDLGGLSLSDRDDPRGSSSRRARSTEGQARLVRIMPRPTGLGSDVGVCVVGLGGLEPPTSSLLGCHHCAPELGVGSSGAVRMSPECS
jgi:hypothetical protein